MNAMSMSKDDQNESMMTELLIKYLYLLYPNYQRNKGKPWTREDDLEKKLPKSEWNEPFRKILTDPRTISVGQQNIIVFRGEREGVGKGFYFDKLVETCYESIPHFQWSDLEKLKRDEHLFRFPILVDEKTVELLRTDHMGVPLSVSNVTAYCFITQLKLQDDEQKNGALRLATHLADEGMLALFIKEKDNRWVLEFIREMKKSFPSQEGAQLPLLVFVVGPDFASDISGNENPMFHCVDFGALTEHQILRYLALELPSATKMLYNIQKNQETIRILSKQERLLKQVAIWKSRNDTPNILQIESDFIKETLSGSGIEKSQLCKAAKQELAGEPISPEVIDALKATDFFNGQRFNYADSKYYLIAEAESKRIAVNDSTEELGLKIRNLIKKYPPDVEYYYAEFYLSKNKNKYREEQSDKYYEALCSILSEKGLGTEVSPAIILARTLLFTNDAESKIDVFMDWASKELSFSTYDEKIFEALELLCEMVPPSKIGHALRKSYSKTDSFERKRRIVYLYSHTHGLISIPDIVVHDLSSVEDATDQMRHLRYHIISTLIEIAVEDSADASESYLKDARFIDWPNGNNDPILQSDFEKYYYIKEKTYYNNSGDHLDNGIDKLLNLLSEGECWEKAHAAGALCRRVGLTDNNIKRIIIKLSEILEKELVELRKSAEIEHLKSISYIVDAYCTLAKHESALTNTTVDAHKRLLELLARHIDALLNPDIVIDIYEILNSALLLLVCGLACWNNSAPSLRKLLGEQFLPGSSLANLLQTCGAASFEDLCSDMYDEELAQKIQKWREPTKLEYEHIVSIKYDVSVGQISVDGIPKGTGFLLREGRIVYCITCKHLFDGLSDFREIAFRPIFQQENRVLEFQLGLLFPSREKLCEKVNPSTPARDDICVLKTDSIPHDIYDYIFTLENLADQDYRTASKERLMSYAFPDGANSEFGEANGAARDYTYNGNRRNGYCCFSVEQEKNNGFSGAPIVDTKDKIFAIHNGQEGSAVVYGINPQIIKNIMDKKEWEQNE